MIKDKHSNSLKGNEVDLSQILYTVLDAKKLIIFITLLSVILATYVANSRPTLFKSIALIEIGQFYKATHDEISKKISDQVSIIEDPNDLIRVLKIKFNYTNHENIDIFKRETNLIQAETIENIGYGDNLLNELVTYIQDRHTSVVDNYNNQQLQILKTKIEYINSTIKFNEDLLAIEKESNKQQGLDKLNHNLLETEKNITFVIRRIKNTNAQIEHNNQLLNSSKLNNELLLESNKQLGLNNRIKKVIETEKDISFLSLLIKNTTAKINFQNELLAKETEMLLENTEQDISFLTSKIKRINSKMKFNNELLAEETEMLLENTEKGISFLILQMNIVDKSTNILSLTQEKLEAEVELEALQKNLSIIDTSSIESDVVYRLQNGNNNATNTIKDINKNLFDLSLEKLDLEAELTVLQKHLTDLKLSLDNNVLNVEKDVFYKMKNGNIIVIDHVEELARTKILEIKIAFETEIKDINKNLLDLSLEKLEAEAELISLQKNLTELKLNLNNAVLNDDNEFFNKIETLRWVDDHLEIIDHLPAEIKNLSKVIFSLTQDKLTLEAEIKLFELRRQYNTKTELVGEITSSEIYSKSLLIIIFGFISGLILSITLVFTISAFKNILKDNKT